MFDALLRCQPTCTGLVRARDAGLAPWTLSHAGPPFSDRTAIPKPVLHALAGAVVLEGWVPTHAHAIAAIVAGDVALRPNHDLGIVSPMAGVVRPSQPLFLIEDAAGCGRRTYATLAEKGRQTLRFGCFDERVAHELAALETDVAPAVERALPVGGLAILPIVAEAVALGDDVHQRNVGGLLAFLRTMPDLPASARSFLGDHPQFFLNFAMAAAKLVLDGLGGLPGSSLVTAISRNGVECGVRLAGTGDCWFTAPATIPVGGIFAPYRGPDAQPDLGDSAIMEAFGLGGCIAHLSLELTKALAVSPADALEAGRRQRHFFAARHDRLSSVASGEAGVGIGLDARRVLACGDDIRIHTGIAHRDGRSGWIGIGVAKVPRACLEAGVRELDRIVETREPIHEPA